MPIAAAYARFSDDSQRPTSIEDQLRNCRRIAALEGFTLVERLIFSDDAVTGRRSGTASRDSYRQLIDAVEARECDVLVVDEMSRLTRDMKEGGAWLDRVEDHGLRIVTGDGVDSSKKGWRTTWAAKLMLAGMEVEHNGDRTTRGMIGQLERGYQIAAAPFGYRPVKDVERGRSVGTRWVIHEEEAQVVRQMYGWRKQGMSAAGIAAQLQAQGVAPPGVNRKGGSEYWRAASVYRLLSNTAYRGVFVWNGSSSVKSRARRRRQQVKEIAYERPQLRIVSDELWGECNQSHVPAHQRNRSPRGGGKNLFAGLVRCGDCKSLLAVGGTRKSRSLHCPQCDGAVRVGGRNVWLGYTSVGAAREALEHVLLKLFSAGLLQEFHERLQQRLLHGPAQEEQDLKRRLKELDARAERLKVLLMNPDLSPERFAPELTSTEHEVRVATARLSSLGQRSQRQAQEALALQMAVQPTELLRQLLRAEHEVYKARATLRRLLASFEFVGRPRKGCSVFRIALQPGVCVAEFSDTDVIDSTSFGFEVSVCTTARRPVVWEVSARRL